MCVHRSICKIVAVRLWVTVNLLTLILLEFIFYSILTNIITDAVNGSHFGVSFSRIDNSQKTKYIVCVTAVARDSMASLLDIKVSLWYGLFSFIA